MAHAHRFIGAVRRSTLLLVAVGALFAPLASRAADAAPLGQPGAPVLVPIHLPEGIDLSLPADWLLLSDSRKNRLQHDVNEAANGIGEHQLAASTRTLLAARTGPGPAAASMSIQSIDLAPGAADVVRREAQQEPEAVSRLNQAHLREALTATGASLIRFDGTKLEAFDGRPALVTRYERSKAGEAPRTVRITAVLTDRRQIVITQGYSSSNGAEGASLIDKIRDTIKVTE
jgi:hypothetical protein